MKLSICIMVKNEEKHLDKCLKSLDPLRNSVDSELIIVDTGSTDNTVEIAKKYTDKIYFHQWNNNFSEMRNITIGYSTGEWFFYIDGDEIMYNPEDMINFLKSDLSNKYNSASVVIKNITDESNLLDFSIFSAVRLMKKYKNFRFEGAIHNQPMYQLPVYDLNTSFLHYGYISTDKELMERKFKRTASILKEELEKNPRNIYYWYQLSVSYSMHDEYDKAIEPIETAYGLLKENEDKAYGFMYVYAQLALVYLMNKQYEKCEKVCKESLNNKDGYLDIYYYLSSSQGMLGKIDEAIESYHKYLEILDKHSKDIKEDKSIINYTTGRRDEVYKNLIVLYIKKEDYDKALFYSNKIENENMIVNALISILSAYIKKEDYKGLKEYYKDKLKGKKELENLFYTELESKLLNLKEEAKISLLKEFTQMEESYGVLSKVRLKLLNNALDCSNCLVEDISSLNFVNLNSFFGDIIYYLLKCKVDLSKVLHFRENHIVRFIEYITEKYEDINEVIYYYLKFYSSQDLKTLRINKVLERTLLILDRLEECKYKEIFYRFIDEGNTYIENVYNNQVIENEMILDFKNDEEEFLLYIHKAKQIKNIDTKLYISYLRKALQAYPYMKKGIEFLKEDLQNELKNENNEFEQYRSQVKNTIRSLIQNGHLNDAKVIIEQYEQIAPDDVETVLFKSQIAIKQIQDNSKYKMQ